MESGGKAVDFLKLKEIPRDPPHARPEEDFEDWRDKIVPELALP